MSIRHYAAVAAMVALVAACSPANEASPSGADSQSAGPSAAATTSGASAETLVVDFQFDHKNADPAQTVAVSGNAILRSMYSSLLTFTSTDLSKPQPDVAKSYEVAPDARTVTFTLRDDIKFSDGTPLTAADVLFTFNRFINLHGAPSFLLNGVTVSSPDDHTVVLQSAEPNPALPYIVTSPYLGILNSKVLKANGGTDAVGADKTDTATTFLASQSAGSGPYVLQTFSTTDQVIVKRNPTYSGPASAFETVVFRNMPSATQALNVQKGTYEVAFNLDPTQAASLQGVANVTVDTVPVARTFWVFANANPAISTITSNKDFLEAVRYGIDYDGLVSLAGSGATRAAGVIPPMILGALDPSNAVKQDVDRAKAALARSGLGNPTVTMEYPANATGSGISYQLLAEKVKSDLAQIGITIDLIGSPLPTFIDHYRSGKSPMILNTWGADYADPSDYLAFLPGHVAGLRAGWAEGADQTVTDLGTTASVAIDSAERSAAYQALQKGLNERSPFVTLIFPSQVLAYTKSLSNVAYSPSWQLDVASIGLAP